MFTGRLFEPDLTRTRSTAKSGSHDRQLVRGVVNLDPEERHIQVLRSASTPILNLKDWEK